jgi:2-oxoglutarate dehydrogenase complex dehydrogenase (E1) component-like enzyme
VVVARHDLRRGARSHLARQAHAAAEAVALVDEGRRRLAAERRREQDDAARPAAAAEIVWVQEEPANMGARAFVRPRLQQLAGDRHVTTVQRSPSASPATGSAKAHKLEHEALMKLAFAHPH